MRLCFPALLFYVGLLLPVVSCVLFLVSDLARLVSTVQIKVVSIYFFAALNLQLESIKTFLTLKLSWYHKSDSMFSSSEPVVPRTLTLPVFVLDCPSIA